MERNEVKRLHEDLRIMLEQFFGKYNMEYIPSSLRYGTNDISIKVQAVKRVPANVRNAKNTITQDEVNFGLAQPMTVLSYIDHGKRRMCTVLKSARSRYHCRCNETGQNFSIPFRGLKV